MFLQGKKVLLVANTAWSIFNFRFELVSSLISNGCDVSVIAPNDPSVDKLIEMGCDFIPISMSARGVNPITDLLLFFRLYFEYKKRSPDVIIHYTIKPNIYGSLAAALASIPSLAITTGLGYVFVKDNFISKIARFLYLVAFKFPRQVWFLNEEDRREFLSCKLVADENAFLLHSEGVNLTRFSPQPVSASHDCFRFLLISRMLWDKGVDDFITAARKVKRSHPDVIFQLLGPCDVANPSAISRLQINEWVAEGVVEYLGVTDDVREYIANADCVVLPSFYREGVPRTLLEAAAMAKPVITTDNVGCRDVVLDGITGFLCAPHDANQLAECCQRIIAMPPINRELMGEAGRKFMQRKFDVNNVIDVYFKFLCKCMSAYQ